MILFHIAKAAVEFFLIDITSKYRWKLAIFPIIVNHLSCLDSAQYPCYGHSDDSSDFWLQVSTMKNLSFGINKCVYEIISKLPCVGIITGRQRNHFWPKTSKWETPNICEFFRAYRKHSRKFRTPFYEFPE